MSKVKMKCARCGKHFKSAQAKQILCPDCEARERRLRAANKAAPAQPTRPAPAAPVAAPRVVGPGASILVPGAVSASATPREAAQAVGPAPSHPAEHRQPSGQPAPRPAEGEKAAKHTTQKAAKPPRAEKAARPREPRPPTPPFELTDDLRARIESRYLELAQPIEFDGIRTQIAGELSIPKAAVKRAVQELRVRMQLPSWWDLRAYTGSEEDLARIKSAYGPLLPVPEVGVHKKIAAELDLNPAVVYQGIRRIRAEMQLPQYNPPELHPEMPTRQSAAPADSAGTSDSSSPSGSSEVPASSAS
jgi:predicted  nucleic acid-binding Zn-ribbon protein